MRQSRVAGIWRSQRESGLVHGCQCSRRGGAVGVLAGTAGGLGLGAPAAVARFPRKPAAHLLQRAERNRRGAGSVVELRTDPGDRIRCHRRCIRPTAQGITHGLGAVGRIHHRRGDHPGVLWHRPPGPRRNPLSIGLSMFGLGQIGSRSWELIHPSVDSDKNTDPAKP